MPVEYVKIPDCQCVTGEKCEYNTCVNCGGTNIKYGNWSHCCQDCNTLQDVKLLEPTITCNCGNVFPREEQECPKCMLEFWS